MNKNRNRLLVQCFIKMLQQRMEKEKADKVSIVFASLLSKEELQSIVKWCYKEEIPEKYDLETMDKYELLDAIGDDFHILSYSIEKWKKELEENVTSQKVYEVLTQLNLETHYLMTKLVDEWDEYDQSNFKALCQKAGTDQPLFAVFDSSIKEDDKYIALPFSKYYRTQWEAESASSLLVAQEQFQSHQLKIIML